MPTDYARAAVYARQTIELILEAGLPAGRCATINLPALLADQVPTDTMPLEMTLADDIPHDPKRYVMA